MLDFEMHEAQIEVYNSPALYKVCAAGRRFGKTWLAAMLCIIEGFREVNQRGNKPMDDTSEVMYMAPTFEQAKGIFWPVLKKLAKPVTATVHENTGVLTLINGVRIRLKGMDNPDRARGFKLRFAVLDEYADMNAGAWEAIIQPALMDMEGGALFIGTPKGKNHFYKLFTEAHDVTPKDGFLEWAAFQYSSTDNPTTPRESLSRMYESDTYSSDLRAQELEADFLAGSDGLLKADWWKFDDREPADGYFVVSVDLQGFVLDPIKKKKLRKDDTVISVVKVCKRGWWVKEQISGAWDTRETALRIVNAARSCSAVRVGIERGALMNAVMPYLDDVMAQYRQFYNFEPLSHGNQNKELRIQWALQGRLEKGRIILNCDPDLQNWERPPWVNKLIEQGADFPNPATPDDCPDSLAYVDQLATTVFMDVEHLELGGYDEWEALDEWSGV